MKLPEICIRHPVFATVMSILLIVVGLVSLQSLSVRYFPEFKQHTAVISASVPGASAVFMYNEVTQIIENSITGIDGIDKVSSTSSDSGSCRVTVTVNSSANYYAVVEELRNKVASIQAQLPAMQNAPSVSDDSGVDYNSMPTLTFGFFSDTLSMQQVDKYVRNIVVPRLQNIPGVGGLPRFGQPRTTLWIWLDPVKMAQLHVTTSELDTAISSNNININSGSIISLDKNYALVSNTLLRTPQQFSDIIIRYENNQPVRVGDVATVEWGSSNIIPRSVRINGKRAIALEVRPFASANPVSVAKRVLVEMNKIKKKLPAGILVKNTYDQATFIQSSIDECIKAIVEAIVLVAVIVLIFLGSLRMALIPIVTIPVCIIASFAVMGLFGFTLNVVSLLAMVLAIGLVVDDAIVVVENTHRHIDEGKTPFTAAIVSAKELIFAIIAMTLTLVAVYIPIGLSHGFTATIFREFSFTLAGAVLISGFVALTLSPMMCAYLLKPVNRQSPISLKIESFLLSLSAAYHRLLSQMIERRLLVLVMIIVCMLLGGFIYNTIGKELVPKEDIGYLETNIKLPPAVNQNYINRNMSLLDEQLLKQKTFADVLSFYISGPTNFITMKPWNERKKTTQDVVKELSPKINQAVPGFDVSLSLPDPVDYGTGSTGFSLHLMTLNQSATPIELKLLSDKVVALLKKYPALGNVKSSLVYNTPQIQFSIRRELASKLGVSLIDIQNSLNVMMGGAPRVTQIKTANGESYDVRAQLSKKYLGDFNVLNSIYVKATANGESSMVPLSELVTITHKTNTPSIETYKRERSATITATIVPGYSLSSIEKHVTQLVQPLLNVQQAMAYGGSIEQMNKSQSSTTFLFVLAIVFIYLILSAQFESFIDPFIIMLTVPLTIVGALLALWMVGGTLNVYSNIGLVTLIGLVTKHGILIVQFANKLIEQGKSYKEAVLEAAETRLRPILMTSLAMIFGVLPLVMATGPGSIGRFNIGLVLAGGLLLGTLFSLFIVPVAYLSFAKYRSSDVLNLVFNTNDENK